MKKIVLLAFLSVLLSLVAVVSDLSILVVAHPAEIVVPDDYTTIQGAINNANDGDTICVRAGVYYEHVSIDKNGLRLIGENRSTTIIDGNGTGSPVYITANSVTVTGFKIRNSRFEYLYSGIRVDGCNYNNITGNTLTNDFDGIFLTNSANNTICNNIIINNDWNGVHLKYVSNHNNIHDNIISNNRNGINMEANSDDNEIVSNEITNHEWDGIDLVDSSRNEVINNNITDCFTGIYLNTGSPTYNVIYHNNFINNTYQVTCYALNNTWDNSYLSGGNYWSDYTGVDLYGGPYQNVTGPDGIGDTSYIINTNNLDRYPLIRRYGSIRNLNISSAYLTIQSAINAPETLDRHIIFVEEGAYYENVILNKSISLIGENKVTTIIDGNMTATVVAVTADNVTISEFTIRNGGGSYAGISLSSNGNTITNNTMWNNWNGISLEHHSAYNIIAHNNITNNLNGISGELWSDSTIIGNILKDNLLGIWIGPYSKRNTIAFNNIRNHWSEGISMWQSSNNIIIGNNITDNNQGGHWSGIVVGFSSYNQFFHNNIANKEKQIDVQGEVVNVWDDGYPCGGNYWSDYISTANDTYSGPFQSETGSDGIEDTSYIIDANNTDTYPLMGPISFFKAFTWDKTTYYVHTVSNSTVSEFYFSRDYKLVSFDVNETSDTIGFCRVTIPKELMWCDVLAEWNVTINGNPPTYLKAMEDADHTYLYFTYNHSIQEVQIKGTHVMDTTKPSIGTVLQEPQFPDDGEGVTIAVNVTDEESGVHSVTIFYSADGGETWHNITMEKTTGDTYEGEIPGQSAETNVQYKIIAYDKAGNFEIGDNLGQYYIYTITPEFPTWTSILIILIVFTVVIIIYKRRLLKTLIH